MTKTSAHHSPLIRQIVPLRQGANEVFREMTETKFGSVFTFNPAHYSLLITYYFKP